MNFNVIDDNSIFGIWTYQWRPTHKNYNYSIFCQHRQRHIFRVSHCWVNLRSSHSQLEQFANKLLINEAKHATAKNKDSLIKLRHSDADDENKEI